MRNLLSRLSGLAPLGLARALPITRLSVSEERLLGDSIEEANVRSMNTFNQMYDAFFSV